MRIAHVLLGRCNPDSANGVDKTVYHLARHQAALGEVVAVVSLTEKEPLPVPGAEVLTLPPPSSKLGSRLPMVPRGLLREILGWKPDLVHFHSVHIGPFVALGRALRSRGIPYVVTPNGGFAPGRLEQVGPEVRAYVRLIEKPYLEGARFVHAVSHNDVEGLRLLGVEARVVVVPNGIDPVAVPAQVDTDLLPGRFPGVRGKRVFLFLGRMDPLHKGLDLLLEAFAVARQPEAVLVLVGPDWRGSAARLREQARHLGLGERVVFAGPVFGENKWGYLAGADVFMHPSRWEGFSFSVLEALAMGKPVLVSRAADPGEIGSLGAGVTVEPTVAALSEALRTLGRTSAADLERMGRRARALVAEHYNWRTIAARLMEAYEHER
jgi:glycosyltransferase involved in cell wall biosynthesis